MKQNKKYHTLFVLCFLFLNVVYSQQSFEIKEPNFYDIKKERDAFFDNIKQTKGLKALEDEGCEYQSYKRWCSFWEPRLYPNGNFKDYFTAEKKWTEEYISTHAGFQRANTDPWHEVGPTQKPQSGVAPAGSGVGASEMGVGIIRHLSICPTNSSLMLCGSPAAGLFFSNNGGVTWNNTGSDTKWGRSGCSSATFSINNVNTWYASTCVSSGNDWGGAAPYYLPWLGSSGGIMRTMDQGVTWEQIGNNVVFGWVWASVLRVIADPSDANVLYVIGTNGIYKTSNATAVPASSVVWTQIFSAGMCYDFEFKPGLSSTIYISAQSGGTTGPWQIYSSTDAGLNWNVMAGQPTNTNNWRITLEVTPANSNYVYALYPTGSFYRFDSSSGVWTFKSSSTSIAHGGGNAFAVSKFNADELYLGHSVAYQKSTNGGSTLVYQQPNGQFHHDIEYMTCSSTNSSEVWMCTHGGVSKSIDNGANWINMGVGLGVAEVTGMNTSYTNPEYVGVGLYHDGTLLTQSSYSNNWTPNWATVYGGDGFKPYIDYTDPKYIYVASQGNHYVMSSSYGNPSSYLGVGWQFGEHYSYIEPNSEDPTVAYGNCYQIANKHNVWRHERNTSADAYISDFASPPYNLTGTWTCWRMYSAPSNSNYLYMMMHQVDATGGDHIRVYRTTVANATASVVKTSWVEITQALTNRWVADITIDLSNPEIVYYSYSGYGNSSGMVYKVDYTSSTTTPVITNLSYNLPQTYVAQLVQEKGSNGALYVATDFGVYYTNNERIQNGTYWQTLGTGLPNVSTQDGLEINYQINKIRIGTYGRGVWEHDLYCPNNYDLNLTGAQTGTLFLEAENDITSTASVIATANVTYRAGNKIVLSPNFRATNGSYFHAFIHPCSHSGNSFKESDLGYSDDAIANFGEKEEDFGEEGSIAIYPNPNNGMFSVELNSLAKGTIEVYDVLGNKVQKIELQENVSKYNLDLSSFSKGMYMLNVISEDKKYSAKIVVE